MKLSATLLTVASIGSVVLPTLAAPAQHVDVKKRDAYPPKLGDGQTCNINAAVIDQWDEAGMRRYRTAFSVTGTGGYETGWFDGVFIEMWWAMAGDTCAYVAQNQQTWMNGDIPSWVMDESEVAGPAGSNAISCLTEGWIKYAMAWSGCATG